MRGFSRTAESILFVLLGGWITAPPAAVLLILFGLSLTDPSRPDYYEAKFRMMMFSPSAFITWPCLAVVAFGLGVGVVGGLRPFLRGRPGE